MAILLIGLALFIGLHLLPVFAEFRSGLVSKFSEQRYKLLFSVGSLAGIVLIFVGFDMSRDTSSFQLFEPHPAFRHITMLLMLPVFILLAASVTSNNIRRVTKHPQILAIKLWAFSHLLSNGELNSFLLFSLFLCWGIIGRISMKRRDLKSGQIAEREVSKTGIGHDLTLVAIGLVLYAVFFWKLHYWIVGVPLI